MEAGDALQDCGSKQLLCMLPAVSEVHGVLLRCDSISHAFKRGHATTLQERFPRCLASDAKVCSVQVPYSVPMAARGRREWGPKVVTKPWL